MAEGSRPWEDVENHVIRPSVVTWSESRALSGVSSV